MTDLQRFGARLAQERREKAAREKRDISQVDVAEAVGTTSASVSRWEDGLNWPKDEVMQRLATYFGVTPAWLRYAQEPKVRAEPTPPPAVKPETHDEERQSHPTPRAKPGKGSGGSGRRAG